MNETPKFKVGDEVFITRPSWGDTSYELDTIKTITALRGDIKLTKNVGIVFTLNGRQKGNDLWSIRARLELATPELKANVASANLRYKHMTYILNIEKVALENLDNKALATLYSAAKELLGE